MVQNAGNGPLLGTANVSAPFSIISGGSYSLGSGVSQTVTVRYSPTGAGSHSNNVTFTGGGGVTRPITGAGVNPSNILWLSAADVGGGWKWLAWFGYFSSPSIGEGWIFHQEHAWMYCIGTATSSIWFWTSDMGWLWSSDTVYPSLYRISPAAWLWYQRGGQAPNRWFLNLATGAWDIVHPIF